jgi:hypothetical protein
MDYAGPLLMAAALVVAGFHSRSLVPAGMAAVIMIILFPELKAKFEETFTTLGWGSGMGSSWSALGMVVACFLLRRWPFLRELGEGDRFLDTHLFPLRRYDHSLFTWPLVASAAFLVCRTETVTLFRNLQGDIPLKTALAILLTGVTWTLLAVYLRQSRGAKGLTLLGLVSYGAGWTLLHARSVEPFQWQTPAASFALWATALFLGYRFLSQGRLPFVRALLTEPTRVALRFGTLLATGLLLLHLARGNGLLGSWLLAVVLVGQLLWHGVHRRRGVYGWFLFALCAAIALVQSSPTGTLLAFDATAQATSLLVLVLVLQVAHLGGEGLALVRRRFGWLARPFQWCGLAVGLVLAGMWVVEAAGPSSTAGELPPAAKAVLLSVLLLAARANRHGLPLLVASLLGYHLMCGPADFVAPWRVGLLAVDLVALVALGAWMLRRWPVLIRGAWPVVGGGGTARFWLLAPACGIAVLATVAQLTLWRGAMDQLGAAYLATAALVWAGTLWPQRWLLPISIVPLTLGNSETVRLTVGDWLRDQGLSELHLFCVALVATMGMVLAARSLLSAVEARRDLSRGGMVLAGTTLFLLVSNYLVRPNLKDISSTRFLVSGLLAYASAVWFRFQARDPHRVGRAADLCEAAYHFGVTLALWCLALLIPELRSPQLALLALSLPVLYFAARAEAAWRGGSELTRGYRNSAVALGSVVLALYAFRAAFQLTLFPGDPVQTEAVDDRVAQEGLHRAHHRIPGRPLQAGEQLAIHVPAVPDQPRDRQPSRAEPHQVGRRAAAGESREQAVVLGEDAVPIARNRLPGRGRVVPAPAPLAAVPVPVAEQEVEHAGREVTWPVHSRTSLAPQSEQRLGADDLVKAGETGRGALLEVSHGSGELLPELAQRRVVRDEHQPWPQPGQPDGAAQPVRDERSEWVRRADLVLEQALDQRPLELGREPHAGIRIGGPQQVGTSVRSEERERSGPPVAGALERAQAAGERAQVQHGHRNQPAPEGPVTGAEQEAMETTRLVTPAEAGVHVRNHGLRRSDRRSGGEQRHPEEHNGSAHGSPVQAAGDSPDGFSLCVQEAGDRVGGHGALVAQRGAPMWTRPLLVAPPMTRPTSTGPADRPPVPEYCRPPAPEPVRPRAARPAAPDAEAATASGVARTSGRPTRPTGWGPSTLCPRAR